MTLSGPDASSFPYAQLPGALELAFVGDSVYDLYVRSLLTLRGGKVNALNRKASDIVNAASQAQALERIRALLTEDEALLVCSARNAHQTPPKNQTLEDYRRATALEALLGYLYLTGRHERLEELLAAASGLRKEPI